MEHYVLIGEFVIGSRYGAQRMMAWREASASRR
jgi:hypothetical protein